MSNKDARSCQGSLVRSSRVPRAKILETERRFKIEVEGAQVKGRLDRLDRLSNGDVAIIDYKTGKPKTQDDADDSLQLSIYALAGKSLGHTPSSLVFINLTNGDCGGVATLGRESARGGTEDCRHCGEDCRRRV